MSLTTTSFLHLPPIRNLKLAAPTSSFLHGSTPLSQLTKPTSSLSFSTSKTLPFYPTIKALKSMQGRVVCATSDKTVAVEVVRLAPHPKYKRRVKKKKKYQAHDPDNQFKVGDVVLLNKTRPISKTKTFLAVPVPDKQRKKKENEEEGQQNELGIPFESQEQVV